MSRRLVGKPIRLIFPQFDVVPRTFEILTVDSDPVFPSSTGTYILATLPEAKRPWFTLVETANSHAIPKIEAALQTSYNVGLEALDYVFVTHAHLDHCAGAGQILRRAPRAKVLCHPNARKHLVDPTALLKSALKVYGEAKLKENVGDMIACEENRVVAMKDGESLYLDHPLEEQPTGNVGASRKVTVLHSLGHAKHHCLLHDHMCSSVFAGDNFGVSLDNIDRPEIFLPATAPIDFDHFHASQTISKILSLNPQYVFPTHFGVCSDPLAASKQLLSGLEHYEIARVQTSVLLQSGFSDVEVLPLVTDRLWALLQRQLGAAVDTDRKAKESFLKLNIEVNAQGLVVAAVRNPVKLDGDRLPAALSTVGSGEFSESDDALTVAVATHFTADSDKLESMKTIVHSRLSGKLFRKLKRIERG